MRLLAALFVCFLAAGCMNVVPHPAGNPRAPSLAFEETNRDPAASDPETADSGGPGSLARVVSIVDPSGGEGEPSLGVAPDGSLFTNGWAYQGAAGHGVVTGGVYKSIDGGASWDMIATPTSTPNYDPDLAVDADGTVWFDTLWIGCTSVATSRDGGKTWRSNPLACVPPAGDRQYVVPTQGGTAYVFSHHRPTMRHMVAKTTDYGATWLPIGSVEDTVDPHQRSKWAGGGFWNRATGSVFLTYTRADSPPFDTTAQGMRWFPTTSVTRDNGSTWSVARLPNNGGAFVGLSLVVGAAADDGTIYLAWAEALEGGEDMAVFLAHSKDDGRTWAQSVRVDDGNGSKVFPAITAGKAGRVAIAYYESDVGGHPGSVTADASWNVTLAWTRDATAEVPTFERGTLSQHTVHRGPVCPDGAICSEGRELLDYFSLETLTDGRVASVWTSTEDVAGKTVNVFAATEAALLR